MFLALSNTNSTVPNFSIVTSYLPPKIHFDIKGILALAQQVLKGIQVDFVTKMQECGFDKVLGFSQISKSGEDYKDASSSIFWDIKLGSSKDPGHRADLNVFKAEDTTGGTSLNVGVVGMDGKGNLARSSENKTNTGGETTISMYDKWIADSGMTYTEKQGFTSDGFNTMTSWHTIELIGVNGIPTPIIGIGRL